MHRYETLRSARPILSYWAGYTKGKENELQGLIQGARMRRTTKTKFSMAKNIIRFVVRPACLILLSQTLCCLTPCCLFGALVVRWSLQDRCAINPDNGDVHFLLTNVSDTATTRAELKVVRGIGPCIANKVLLYALGHDTFVVDVNVLEVLVDLEWAKVPNSWCVFSNLSAGHFPSGNFFISVVAITCAATQSSTSLFNESSQFIRYSMFLTGIFIHCVLVLTFCLGKNQRDK